MKLLILFSLVLFGACKNTTAPETSTSDEGAFTPEKEIALTIPPGPDNPRNSEGDFITLKNGRLLFIYTHFIGDSYMDDAPAYLVSRYSDDQGKTWSSHDKLILKHENNKNLMSVSLLRLQNGEIGLFYLRKNSTWDCIPWMMVSTDEGKSWSDPIPSITDKKGYFVLNNDRVIQLKNGRILLPVSQHFVKEGKEWDEKSRMGRLSCYYSDDNGRTWKVGSEVPNPDNALHQEPGVVQLNNENLFMFIRSDRNVQYKSYSYDNGETWSPSEPSNIKSPISPASMVKTPASGELLLVWNNNNGDNPIIKGKRTPLNLALSKDDGKSWQRHKIIEDNPDGSFCYTAIHFIDDHVLLAYFDWSNRQTSIHRLSKKWIYN